jgi:hypothetical protein
MYLFLQILHYYLIMKYLYYYCYNYQKCELAESSKHIGIFVMNNYNVELNPN